MISSFISGNERILRLRKRPKETSSKAKTTRVPFGNQATKVLSIPTIADEYNYHIGAVDEFNHLTTQNASLWHVERGGYQALEHWLLRTVLINCYLLALCSDLPEPREVNFRSQQDFRRQLISALITKSNGGKHYPKRGISRISGRADQVPIKAHKQVKLKRVGEYVNCKGLRFTDRPKRRLLLSQIAANQGRGSSRHESQYGYEQCDIHLCKKRGYFNIFHRERQN